jgi:glycosyltransferase involved in cell wall biosynthesis
LADFLVPEGLDTGFWDILYRSGHIAVNSYDIVHGFDHLPNVSFPSFFARKFRRTCFISDWCDWWSKGGFSDERFKTDFRKRMEAFLEEGIRKIADGVTVISSVLYERAKEIGVPEDKIRIIPSGADADFIRPLSKNEARSKLGLPQDVPILGFFGFVHQDVDLVIEAIKHVSEKIPSAKALIVGLGSKAEQTAIDLGIKDKVIIAGVKPYVELPDYYAASDVLALPLRNNIFNRARWPNKIGDHLAAGRPTVSHPVGDVQHLFKEHNIGLLAREDEPLAFADQVTRLFNDPELARRMGSYARDLAEGEYSWEKLSNRLEEFYEETLSRRY